MHGFAVAYRWVINELLKKSYGMQHQCVLVLSCADKVGIVAEITAMCSSSGINIIELSQFSDAVTGRFFMRLVFHLPAELALVNVKDSIADLAHSFDMEWSIYDKAYRPNVLILVSKESHCLNDLLHRLDNQSIDAKVVAVVSNHQALEDMSSWYHVPFHYLPINADNKKAQEAQLTTLIEQYQVDVVVLAKYMQILSEGFCEKFSGKLINIHHSFLPSFKGAKPYHQAYERGVKAIGATAHYVTKELDEGPIIEQDTVKVRHDHMPSDLVQLGRDIESQVLARAIKHHVEYRVFLNGHKTVVFE